MDERYLSGELEQSRHLWPDLKQGPWIVDLTWELVDGRRECVGAELRSYTKSDAGDTDYRRIHAEGRARPSPVTATTWRQVPIGSLIDSLRQELREYWQEAEVSGVDDEAAGIAQQWQRRGRRPRHDPAAVAEVYTRAWHARSSPTLAVAESLGISRSAAAKQVARARALGLLPVTTRGRPEGQRIESQPTNKEE